MQITFNVANIIFSVHSNLPEASLRVDKNYNDFICHDDPFIEIWGHYGMIDSLSLKDYSLIFDSEENWSLYKQEERRLFVLKIPSSTKPPFCVAEFDRDYRKGTIHISSDFFKGYQGDRLPFPLFYPLAEIFMITFLAQKRGLLVHACGINDNGRGYLLTGNSGNGKSTSANIWKKKATILNDDRIVIRFREGKFFMYGTPWHGDYTGTSPEGIAIERIFFLQHGDENKMVPRTGAQAVAMLLARAFPPFWDDAGMDFSLQLLNDLVNQVPCHDLSFVPDEDIIDFVRCAK